MANETIKTYLEQLKAKNQFDTEFIDLLISSYETTEEGDDTAEKILSLIEKRYAQDQGHKG